MSTDSFSAFVKATRLYFPQGHPMRSAADTVSNIDTARKYQYLQNTHAQLQYQLDKVAHWERMFPNINYSRYKEKILNQLIECDKQIQQLEKDNLCDEAQISAKDKLRLGSR